MPVEVVTNNATGDWLTCVPSCGNEPHMEGFQPCLPDGTEVEPLADGPWGSGPGKYLYVCGRCGRIIDQDTLLVVGRKQP
jgi:hypothetical protein